MFFCFLKSLSYCWNSSRIRRKKGGVAMKQIEDYVKDGWHLQLTVTPSRKGVLYHAWAYEHKEDKAAALVGEGETMESMLRDLQECEKELYPHLIRKPKHRELKWQRIF